MAEKDNAQAVSGGAGQRYEALRKIIQHKAENKAETAAKNPVAVETTGFWMVREAGLEVQIFHIWYSIHSILALFLLKTRNSGIIPSTSFQ